MDYVETRSTNELDYENEPVALSPIDAALATLTNASHDWALVEMIKAKMKKSGLWTNLGLPAPIIREDGPPPLFPASSDISLIQTAIFDNWPGGRQPSGTPNRYGASIEIWTAAKKDIVLKKGRRPQHKSNVSLMDHRALKSMIRVLQKPRVTPVDATYLVALESMLEMIERDRWLVGLINTNIRDDNSVYHRGTYYHANQFLMVKMKGQEVERAILILSDQERIDLAPFDDRDAGGKVHGGNVILQSRHDLCDFSDNNWKTNVDG